MKFIYTRSNDEIRIDQIEDPEAVIYVPERFEDCPVTELGSYVLAHSSVEEIHLPPYVRKIGAYGFYECEQLKRIYCYSRVLDLGAGLFAGVPAVEYLDITEFPGERSCLKEMLTELRQTLRVQIHCYCTGMRVQQRDFADALHSKSAKSTATTVSYGIFSSENSYPCTAMIQPLRQAGRKEAGQEILKPEETKQREREQQNLDLSSEKLPEEYEARLIFPEYFEDSVENTPARIVCIETHGCGHRYRYCFAGRVFQYRGYDELFPHVQVQEKEELVTELALGRLLYPKELSEKFREQYQTYIREHWEMAGRLLIQADNMKKNHVSNLEPGKLPWLVEEVLMPRKDQCETWQPELAAEQLRNTEQNQPLQNFSAQLSTFIQIAQESGDTEMVSWLMERRHQLRAADSMQSAGALHDAETIQDLTGDMEHSVKTQSSKRKRRFKF